MFDIALAELYELF